MRDEGSKGIIAACTGVLCYLYNCINEVLVVLAILMILDFLTGVVLAIKEHKWDKAVGVWGFIKKTMYIVTIMLGFLSDYTITSLAGQAGINFSTKGYLGIAVVLYLIGNEGLSLTKNLIALGCPAPPFLAKSFGLLKNTAESIDKKG